MPTLLSSHIARVLVEERQRDLQRRPTSPLARMHDVQRDRVRASLLLRPEPRGSERQEA